jgi:hypothetical protein
LSAATAFGEIACNGERRLAVKRHDYDPAPKLTIHPDSWKWAGHEKYKSREYEGHGWWRGGKWIEIK